MPKVVSGLCNNMGWSSVSNAALWSSKASNETSLSLAFLRRPSTTLSRAVSVLWVFLYTDCLISSRSFSERCFCSCVKTTFSRILEMKGRFDMGQKFLKSFGSSPCFFGRGVTMAFLNWGGMAPEQRELFTILVIRGSRLERHSLVREVGMGSNMQVLVGDSTISLWIFSSVTGLKRQSLSKKFCPGIPRIPTRGLLYAKELSHYLPISYSIWSK